MSTWRVRDLHRDDLDAVLRLWTAERARHREPVHGLSEVLASCEQDCALVAVDDGQVVGAAVGRAAHQQGWVVFREQPGRLLVCATNVVRALDEALLRHGRVDDVIPIGLPGTARDAVDVEALLAASAGFSPADVEHAARAASQSAPSAVLASGHDPMGQPGPTTADCVAAVGATRATVSPEAAARFEEDIASLGRT